MARLHTTLLLASSVMLGACCFSPTATPEPAPVSTAPALPTSAPAAACPELPTAIVGTFAREGVVEEYHADGSYVLNGLPGTITWLRPGHAMVDVPGGSLHMEYDIALVDVTTLVSSDANHIGAVATRTTPPPAIPASCFDLSSAWVGTWTPDAAGPPETYRADGTYAAPGAGHWSFTAPGHLHLVNDDGSMNDYLVGLASPATALAVSLPPLPPMGVAYTRTP